MVLNTANTLSHLFQRHVLKILHRHVHALEQARREASKTMASVGKNERGCASVRLRFTAIGSRNYSETTIQRKARFVFWSSTRELREASKTTMSVGKSERGPVLCF